MVRREPSRRKRGKAVVKRTGKKSRAQAIDETLAELDRLESDSPKIKVVVELFRGWLVDKSGYDEETWPRLKKALNSERANIGARRLFDA
ncbi:MAG TPA: hypothetical protein VJ783_25865 [Pirellulales bacterium]|nr:hypothetical protein [Pirellulales bacterium]